MILAVPPVLVIGGVLALLGIAALLMLRGAAKSAGKAEADADTAEAGEKERLERQKRAEDWNAAGGLGSVVRRWQARKRRAR